MNEEYWKTFYESSPDLKEPSPFAKYVLEKINKNSLLVDLGCGNGKDTFFFRRNGIDSRGIDRNPLLKEDFFTSGDVLEELEQADIYYMRFFAHAIEEEYLDSLLSKINKISKPNSKIFIETRSTKGIINLDVYKTSFTSGIGEDHFRVLYSKNYFASKIERLFEIIELEERNGLSIFNGEDPFLIRIYAKVRSR